MKVLADTNILAKAIIIQDESIWSILKEFPVYCPNLLFAEFGNVLLQYTKHGRYDSKQALLSFEIVRAIITDILAWEPFFERIHEKSLQHKLSFYDAIYLSLAMEHGYPLMTLDRKLAKAAAREGILFEW